MWNIRESIILTWSIILGQTAFAQIPSKVAVWTGEVVWWTSSQVVQLASIKRTETLTIPTATTKENISRSTELVTSTPNSAKLSDQAYQESVAKFRADVAEKVSFTIGDFKLWLDKSSRNIGLTGTNIILKYDIPFDSRNPLSSGNMKFGVGGTESGSTGVFFQMEKKF